MKLIGTALVGLVGMGLGACLLGPSQNGSGGPTLLAEPVLTPAESQVVQVFERTAPSVVFISNIGVRRDFFSLHVEKVAQGTGSGFVWDAKGHVVTNYHVIARADAIQVTLPDQSEWRARVVGVAADKDLAVLRIDAPAAKLSPIPKGQSAGLKVGMTALAIGNPFGLDNTLTKGIISALGREITALTGRTITDVIQTDAAINPGNSGGPLLNARGELIGVNTAILSKSGSSAGIGFAVPVRTVRRVVNQLIRYGKVIRPGLGITYLQDYHARRAGLQRGVMIRSVARGSGAAKAGLQGIRYYRDGSVQLGDIIEKIDEHEIRDSEDLLNALERYQVGNEVEVTYIRDRKRERAKVRLEAVE
ncbi:MAG: trypsin-like peptidase domain-containing protein [Planctomycetota bacterium]